MTVNEQAAARLRELLEAAVRGCGALMACLATPQLAPLAEELLRYCTALVPLAPAAALRCVLQVTTLTHAPVNPESDRKYI